MLAGVLILLAISIRLVVRVPAVQTWLVQRVAGYLSDELQTRIEIGFVDIRLFSSIVLSEVYVEDLQKDTLLYASSLDARIGSFNWEKKSLQLKSVTLDKARIGVKRYASPRAYNVDFIINYFSGTSTDTTPPPAWNIKVENIYLQGSSLSYRDLKYNDTTRCVDFEDILLTQLNLHLTDLVPQGDSVMFNVSKIAFREKSGFVAKGFESAVTILPQQMRFKDLHITTPFSEVNAQLEFNYDDFEDFQEFIQKVRWKAEFAESVLSSDDLCYFASEFFDIHRKVAFHGKARGTVDRFKARELEVRYSPNTYFRGTVNMTGLPDFEETYMEIGAEEVSMRRSDLLTIPVIPGDGVKMLSIPENITSLGVMKFSGKFNGFYNDFVAYGNISTALGFATTDLNLKISSEDRKTEYRGSLKLHQFHMGKFWGMEKDLGLVTMDVKVKGKGFELKNVDANLDGHISRIDLLDYSYSGLDVSGQLKRKLFNGHLAVDDPNLKLDFTGDIDLNGKVPDYNFEAILSDAYIHNLHWVKRDTSSHLSGAFYINMRGNTLDNAQGIMEARAVRYVEKNQEAWARLVSLESVTGDKRQLKLRSDFSDAEMVGDFTVSQLGKSLQWVLASYVPALGNPDVLPKNQEITFRSTFKETAPVTDIFFPEISIAPGTILEGNINTNLQKLNLVFASDRIAAGAFVMQGVNIDGNTAEKGLLLNTTFQNLVVNDSMNISDLKISGYTNPTSADFRVQLEGKDENRSRADIRINAAFPRPGLATVHLIPQELLLNSVSWNLDTANAVDIEEGRITLRNFRLSNTDQALSLSGVIGKEPTDHLLVDFSNFLSEQLNPVLLQFDVQLGGRVNGKADIAALQRKPVIEADLLIDTLRWYSDTLGNAEIKTRFNSESGIVEVDGVVTRGGTKNIVVDGRYLIGKEEDELDFNITLQKTYLNSFSHYLEGIFSNITGVASAKLKLRGPVKSPNLTGKVILQKAGLTVDYLKTAYTFSAELELDETSISGTNITLNDVKGNQGTLTANIYHNHLRDFYLDIDIRARNMQALNTVMTDNDIFYGTAYASGNVAISGYLDNIAMNIGLKSEKGTRINIPLSNPEEISQSTFITFVKHDSVNVTRDSATGPDFSGITLNMDFEVTPEATIALIFDDKIGDVIEGAGSGNLTMTISPSEDLRMFGNIEIVQGRYLFTMQNVINKPFVISPGGYIRWNGDPYDADIKIDAVYKLKTGLYDLFQDSTFKKLVPVDLELHLKDKLFNPAIAFDINVKNVDPTVENQIRRLINTEEEKYRQAMALLVMRRFTVPAEYSNRAPVNSGGVVGANAYELLSNQLSNWVNQLSNTVNVGVNYRPGDAITSEELEVALSTSILNDRVTIDGNVGYTNTTTASNQNTSNLVGDFNVEVKASKDGRVRLKAFNRSNNNSLINNVNSPYTQGVGVFYREEFNSFGELMRKYLNVFRRKEKRVAADPVKE